MRSILSIATLLAFGLSGVAAEPTVKVAVYPPDINLETSRDRQTFVVQATFPDGLTRDVSAEAQIAFTNPALVKREGFAVVPLADGVTEMTVTAVGQTVKVPVKVVKAKEDRPISFKLDVMPVFLRSGCNSGSCHGAARGKDGFRVTPEIRPCHRDNMRPVAGNELADVAAKFVFVVRRDMVKFINRNQPVVELLDPEIGEA